jgi:hypothetical protein
VIRGDASEVYRLGNDLALVNAKAVPALRGSMLAVGEAFAKEWADNARETSGSHGVHYPNSIDADLVFSVRSVTVEAGPNNAKKQGQMGRGFEFGSQNQPPHLDGLRALDGMQLRAERIIDSTIGHIFP